LRNARHIHANSANSAIAAAKPPTALFNAPPRGVMFETKDQVGQHADRLYLRAVATKTMPLGNLTGITEAERDLLGAWVAQGAKVDAAGPVELPTSNVAPPPAPTTKDCPQCRMAIPLAATRCGHCASVVG